MALIDATARFAARREEARRTNGEFGEQVHSEPEMTLTIAQIVDELDEMEGVTQEEKDAVTALAAETTDTYTGTPEERAAEERKATFHDLIRRAGLDADTIPEKTVGEIYDGIERKQIERRTHEEWKARQLPEDEPGPVFPVVTTAAGLEADEAVRAIIAARGDEPFMYHQESLDYLFAHVKNEQKAGTLDESLAAEVKRSRDERDERERENRESQIAHLGELTDDVWAEAQEEDRLRAAQQIRKLRRTQHVPLKETNALIRKDFKEHFGTQKFSVRGDKYAGGASTHIDYVDGPPLDQVESIAKSYAGATFDGMIDLKSYVSSAEFDEDSVPVSVSYGPDYVFCQREFSDDTVNEANALLIKAFKDEGIDFDPNDRSTPREIPQGLYRFATVENGGRNEHGHVTIHRNGYATYANDLTRIASTLVANGKWAARAK
ncbi:LPD29 domain-containing protein [Microbacterium sp. 77mftsu3.1]|uniref:LPD29 domain-containing protein n=1 Tax=Microbacterium sp. 77mftsu3.1 TaxID=1761802 RepID=UPI0003645448|nr:LPD29 domain-containing protein [Microbacterium sp. 77mftsu3.1]SDH32656.1 hypothetical protein SAMN04488590_3034 [Microbacterium sp. 77mftsu3.1]